MLNFSNRNSNLGTESAFDVLARAQKLAGEGREIVNLGIGQPDFATPSHIVDAAVAALKNGHHGYAPANGLPALREAVVRDLNRRHGVTVNPENVIIVPGGKPTMFFAALHDKEPCDTILFLTCRVPNEFIDLKFSRIDTKIGEASPFIHHDFEDQGTEG